MCKEFVCKYAGTCIYDLCAGASATRVCYHELCGLCLMGATCAKRNNRRKAVIPSRHKATGASWG